MKFILSNKLFFTSVLTADDSMHLKGHFTLWKKPLYRRLIVFTTTF